MKIFILFFPLMVGCATTYSGYCEAIPGLRIPVQRASVTTANDGQIVIVDKHQWTKSEPKYCHLRED